MQWLLFLNLSKQQRFSAVIHGAIILIVCRLTFPLSCSPRESCFFSNAWFLPIGPQGLTWNNSRFILNLSIQQSVAFLMRLSCDIEKKTSYFFLYTTFSEKIFTIINIKYSDWFKMHAYWETIDKFMTTTLTFCGQRIFLI